MNIAKKIQLNERDFVNIKNTELYANMLQRRYIMEFDDYEETLSVCEEIFNHCRSVWYLERIPGQSEEYYIYFSTDADASIMDNGWKQD